MGEFKSRLKELRMQAGISQEKLADMLGVTKASISHYERGIRKPDSDTLTALCDIFNVSLDYLVGSSDVTIRFVDSDGLRRLTNGSVSVPVLGRVAAGTPIESIEDIEGWEFISSDLAVRGQYFALRIKGHSMEPRIAEGDIVIVRCQPDAENGDIVIVQENGCCATCKRLSKNESGLSLISFNPSYTPIVYTKEQVQQLPVTILGKVVECRQRY